MCIHECVHVNEIKLHLYRLVMSLGPQGLPEYQWAASKVVI